MTYVLLQVREYKFKKLLENFKAKLNRNDKISINHLNRDRDDLIKTTFNMLNEKYMNRIKEQTSQPLALTEVNCNFFLNFTANYYYLKIIWSTFDMIKQFCT